jgi:uncharacterized alkaline shock family protein YloU
MEPQDTITIAPSVLITMARYSALGVEGVARMGQTPVDVARLVSGHPIGPGIVMEIEDNRVKADLYIVTRPGYSMLDVSRNVQAAIKRSMSDLVGMEVTSVNVHIEDVAEEGE